MGLTKLLCKLHLVWQSLNSKVNCLWKNCMQWLCNWLPIYHHLLANSSQDQMQLYRTYSQPYTTTGPRGYALLKKKFKWKNLTLLIQRCVSIVYKKWFSVLDLILKLNKNIFLNKFTDSVHSGTVWRIEWHPNKQMMSFYSLYVAPSSWRHITPPYP